MTAAYLFMHVFFTEKMTKTNFIFLFYSLFLSASFLQGSQ